MFHTAKKPEIPPRLIRARIAAAAMVDERTVHKYFREPEHVRPAQRNAIRAALPLCGVQP